MKIKKIRVKQKTVTKRPWEFPLSPTVFKNCLIELHERFSDDEEVCHIKMDDVLCKQLESLGFEDGIEIFRGTKKWYA